MLLLISRVELLFMNARGNTGLPGSFHAIPTLTNAAE